MRRALALAPKGWGQTAPNPLVGAVVVQDGQVVGEGYHAHYGAPHAEVMALAAAGPRARRSTLYVTLEPCNHYGKTPPCTEAIIEAGITRVVVATLDPTAPAGGGADYLAGMGIAIERGVEEPAAREINAAFLFSATATRPWITLKIALSREGGMADGTGRQKWLTGESARADVHRLRASADAIATGIGTVLADDPLLTVRGSVPPRVAPSRVVFDRSAATPLASKLVTTVREAPVMIFAHEPPVEKLAALYNAGVQVFEATDISTALSALHGFGMQHVLVEAGPQLAGKFLLEGLVDRLIIFQTEAELGARALGPFAALPPQMRERILECPVLRTERFGADVMTVRALTRI
ncbi:MAG: bifunctional diaminohydroxyphosphoribosylaminopyrimidine deaminase/5-amino-6-(5-phosphoribosylamino)uracil reductase RibD [Gemmatimonadaceae bacterium]|nr:bifunctional diaminohydroxyphosphoribosylaminopyrimidine deaminase/5-amino-6-(5-phosphoribosylamino)uracil reductase RibD [Gemmatimonadaceae bacterium]